MLKFTFLFATLSLCSLVKAGEVAGSGTIFSKSSGTALVKLPLCIDDKASLEKIEQVATANKKSNHKYNGYREALRNDTDAELVARLAYAETLAANCPEKSSAIAPKIIETIGNRIERRKGRVREVVFERDQFASSLNFYGESHYREFLCPQDTKLWNEIYRAAENRLSTKSATSASAINYFLYKHSPKWTKEPWKLAEDKTLTTANVRECIRFFQVPSWK